MSSQRSSDAEGLQTLAPCRISSQFPRPIFPNPAPSLSTAPRSPHRPRPFSVGEIGQPNPPIPTRLRLGPAHSQDEPRNAESSPTYPQRCGACGPLLSCPHRSRRAPFFCGLHALAIHDRCTGTFLAPFKPPDAVSKHVMDFLPCPVVSPLLEVHVDRRERGKVSGDHAPSATTAQDVEDGIDGRPKLCRTGSSSWLGGWKQTTDNPPFRVAEVTRVSHVRILARFPRLSKHPLRQTISCEASNPTSSLRPSSASKRSLKPLSAW